MRFWNRNKEEHIQSNTSAAQKEEVNHWQKTSHTHGAVLSLKELLYYQGKTQLLDLKPTRTIQSKLAGNYLAKSKGRGMEFDEVRHYQPGDDIRTIDWRVTARTGKTHTKLFREEMERPIFVLCDFSSSMFFGSKLLFKSVQAAHLAALIAWSAKKRGDKIGGLLINQNQHLELKPKSRSQAVLQFIHGMLELHQQGLETATQSSYEDNSVLFEDACKRLRRIAKPGARVYVISDFYHMNQNCIMQLAHISRHCEVIGCEITDPLEHQLPAFAQKSRLLMSDGNQQVSVTLGDQKQADIYQNQSSQWFENQRNMLKKHRIQLQSFDASLPLEQQLVGKVKV